MINQDLPNQNHHSLLKQIIKKFIMMKDKQCIIRTAEDQNLKYPNKLRQGRVFQLKLNTK